MGYAINPYTEITLQPLLVNNVAYLLDSPTSAELVFGGLGSSVLVVADDQGHYYIPEYGLNTIDSSILLRNSGLKNLFNSFLIISSILF